MKRTPEYWEQLAHKILRGEVDFAVLDDHTFCSIDEARVLSLAVANRVNDLFPGFAVGEETLQRIVNEELATHQKCNIVKD